MSQIFQDIGKGENFGDVNEDTVGDVGFRKASVRQWALGWDLRNNGSSSDSIEVVRRDVMASQ